MDTTLSLTPQQLIEPELVRDAMVSSITDKVKYPVETGLKSNIYWTQNYLSQSAGQLTSNINFTQGTINNTRLPIQTTTCLVAGIPVNTVPNNSTCFNYGQYEALNSFPINRLILNAQVQIGSSTPNINSSYALEHILRRTSQKELQKWNSMTCTMLDNYFNYSDLATGAAPPPNSPLGTYTSMALDGMDGRGCFKVDNIIVERYVNGTYTDNSTTCSAQATNSWKIFIIFTSVEPIIGLYPLSFEQSQDAVGMLAPYANFTINIDQTCSRVFSTARNYITTLTLGGTTNAASIVGSKTYPAFDNTKFIVNYASPQDTDTAIFNKPQALPMTQISTSQTSAPSSFAAATIVNGVLTPATPITFTSTNFPLNEIPRFITVSVRRALSSYTAKPWTLSETAFPITKVEVQIGSTANILATYSQLDLYNMSRDNGYQSSYNDWCGISGGLQYNNGTDTLVGNSLLSGSFLIIDTMKNLTLDNKYSNGSETDQNFQFRVTAQNFNQSVEYGELIICFWYEHVYYSNGKTAYNTGPVLNNAEVLELKKRNSSNPNKSITFEELRENDALTGGNMKFHKHVTEKHKKGGTVVGGTVVGGMALKPKINLRHY